MITIDRNLELRAAFLALPVLALPLAGAWASPASVSAPLEGIYSRAEVTGPTSSFTTEMVTLADGRARFVQTRAGGRTELLAIGGRGFERDPSGAFVAAEASIAEFVHGHDVPRQAAARGERAERLESTRSAALGGGTIAIELAGWRRVVDRELPFAATFVDAARGGERYAYRYVELLPFRLAPGSSLPEDPAALFARLGDLGELARAHERVMAAHRASDAAALVANGAPESTVSGRGRLSSATRDAALERMRGHLGSIRFSRYDDTVVPVVAVSADGTLGWLACEMEAEGTRTVDGKTEPFAYAFSWVELSARSAGDPAAPWLAIGNASSERP